jgi:four helix bundle protein
MGEKFNLDDRLIDFAALIIEIAESLPETFAGKHMGGQLIRSGTAPALHYGEAQGGESRNDFIHKMKVALKELRETFNGLRIVKRVNWLTTNKLEQAIDENNQLISIFVKSVTTAQKNNKKQIPKKHPELQQKNSEQ